MSSFNLFTAIPQLYVAILVFHACCTSNFKHAQHEIWGSLDVEKWMVTNSRFQTIHWKFWKALLTFSCVVILLVLLLVFLLLQMWKWVDKFILSKHCKNLSKHTQPCLQHFTSSSILQDLIKTGLWKYRQFYFKS